jgi:hypothetical protein
VFEKYTSAVPESEITSATTYRTDFLSRYSEKDINEEKKRKATGVILMSN